MNCTGLGSLANARVVTTTLVSSSVALVFANKKFVKRDGHSNRGHKAGGQFQERRSKRTPPSRMCIVDFPDLEGREGRNAYK